MARERTVFYEKVGPDGKKRLYFDPNADMENTLEVRARLRKEEERMRDIEKKGSKQD